MALIGFHFFAAVVAGCSSSSLPNVPFESWAISGRPAVPVDQPTSSEPLTPATSEMEK